MLKSKLLIATSAMLFAYVANAATIEELEQQLQQMQQQSGILQKQILELKSTQQQQNIQQSGQQVQAVIEPPKKELEIEGLKIDNNNHLLGEGKGVPAVNSLNIMVKNNPAILPSKEAAVAENPEIQKPAPIAEKKLVTDTIEQTTTKDISEEPKETQNVASELQNAIGKVQTGSFAEAQSVLTAYVADNTKPNINVAYYWLGEALFRQSQYEPAAMAFTKSYKQDNKSDIAPDALIRLSLALGLLNRTEEACKLLLHAENSFPNETEKVAIAADERRRLNCQ